MRILIFGVSGMLSHKLYQRLGRGHEVFGTVRTDFSQVERFGLFDRTKTAEHVDASDRSSVEAAIARVRPDYVINAIGIIKQIPAARNAETAVELNAVFPRVLAGLAEKVEFRLITISTDCVFDGTRGFYSETDEPNARDIYGMSKFLGEVDGSHCLTLRTSIIGRELSSCNSIVEWFLSHRGGTVDGYRKALYSGLTTIEFARVIELLLVTYPDLHGVFNVSAEPITKFDLLNLLNNGFTANTRIVPSDAVEIDRTLDSAKLRGLLGYTPPSWAAMITELAADPTPYDTY